MHALTAHGPDDLRIEDVPFDPPAGSAIVRPTHGGICGSDLHYAAEGRVGAFVIRQPLILGHEIVGVVESDPSGRHSPGTRVALHPATPDGTCSACRAGRPHLCPNARHLGSAATDPHTQGGFAERVGVRPEQLRELPTSLPSERGVLAEPLAVAIHALGRAGAVAGLRVHVSGAGPIGLLVARAAVALGAARVTVADLLEPPLDLARTLGAADVFPLRDRTPEPESADIVVEASGAPAALGAAVDVVARAGIIVQVGSLPSVPLGADIARIVSKEVQIRGSFRFVHEIDDAIAMLDRDPEFGRIVTHVLPFREAVQAFAIAANPAVSSKVVIALDEA
ncbi:alcohol dehydrogenase catalytic domain-containing protein [Curtobacterium ammoniigenes]|uniref:alcohol dehydrogenase catalytic domain-containing protein n=1 Tax=Curtobacterium ammoniigenes TaxID=395387 RepID=UPI000835251D|nr:alcohol dehydrogenase catalytic domain-containing protein [Curtobacterium ammoniigenes]